MQNFQVNYEGCLTLHYRPAQVHNNGIGWYIEYATLSDDRKTFHRKRIKLNRLKSKCQNMMEFKTKVDSMVSTIISQLQLHHAPMQTLPPVILQPQAVQYVPIQVQPQVIQYAVAPLPPLPSAEAEQQQVEQAVAELPTVSEEKQEKRKPVGNRKYTLMQRMLEVFVEEKGKELKKTTMVSYSTFCKQLGKWLEKHYPNLKSGEFTQEIAVEYLEFVNSGGNSNDKKQVRNRIDENRVSPRTYNNNMKMGRGIFTWAVEPASYTHLTLPTITAV